MKVKHREKVFFVKELDGERVLHRKCTGNCREVKPVSEFYKQKIGINGIRPKCKSCKKEEDRIYQRANNTKINENNLKWRNKNHQKYKNIQESWQSRNKVRKSGDLSVLFGKYTPRVPI